MHSTTSPRPVLHPYWGLMTRSALKSRKTLHNSWRLVIAQAAQVHQRNEYGSPKMSNTLRGHVVPRGWDRTFDYSDEQQMFDWDETNAAASAWSEKMGMMLHCWFYRTLQLNSFSEWIDSSNQVDPQPKSTQHDPVPCNKTPDDCTNDQRGISENIRSVACAHQSHRTIFEAEPLSPDLKAWYDYLNSSRFSRIAICPHQECTRHNQTVSGKKGNILTSGTLTAAKPIPNTGPMSKAVGSMNDPDAQLPRLSSTVSTSSATDGPNLPPLASHTDHKAEYPCPECRKIFVKRYQLK